MRLHVVLKRFVTIDQDDRHLIVVSLPQFLVEIDVHLAPLKIGRALELSQRLFDKVAQMASLARIHQNFVHRWILTGLCTPHFVATGRCGEHSNTRDGANWRSGAQVRFDSSAIPVLQRIMTC
jgi:hypothetical protein